MDRQKDARGVDAHDEVLDEGRGQRTLKSREMNSAIDAWTRASRSYADGQPVVAEQALRSALGLLPEGKGAAVASNQSIPLIRCALRAAIESCGLTVRLSH